MKTLNKYLKSDLTISVVALLVSLAIALAASAVASAATDTSTTAGNGLKVSPVRTDLTISPGASQDITVYAENVTDTTTEFQVIVNDFTAGSNENGTPDIILNPNQYAAQHSLKRFAIAPPDFTLAPHEQKAVDVKISVPAGTAGGGYYGVVRFLPINVGNSSKNVSVAASVGTLVLLKVPGNLDENLTVASFNVSKNASSDGGSNFFTSGSGIKAIARFTNNGNIQEAPFGKLVLKQGNKVLETKEINNSSPPGDVLPGSTRRFSVPLDKVGSWGKYTVEGNFGYGSSGQLLSVSKTFYVIPLALINGVIVLIILIILGIFLGRRELKHHDRKLLARYRSKSGGRGRR